MADKRTQHARILDYMVRWGWITPITAWTELGISKLATRVSELKKNGVSFESEFVNVKNRFGEDVRVKRYRLNQDAKA